MRNARVTSWQTTILQDCIQACLEFGLGGFVKTGLGKIHGGNGIFDGVLDAIEGLDGLQ